MKIIHSLFSLLFAGLFISRYATDMNNRCYCQNDTISDKKQEELFKSWMKDTLLTLPRKYEVNEDSTGLMVIHDSEVDVRIVRHNKYTFSCADVEDSLLISGHLDLIKDYHKQLPKQFKFYTSFSRAYFVTYRPEAKYDCKDGFDEYSIIVTEKDSVRYRFIHCRINEVTCYYNNGKDSISFPYDDVETNKKIKKMYW